MPIEDQIKEIAATFVDSNKVPRHPTDPSLTAVDSLPVFPNFDAWKNEYVVGASRPARAPAPLRSTPKNVSPASVCVAHGPGGSLRLCTFSEDPLQPTFWQTHVPGTRTTVADVRCRRC